MENKTINPFNRKGIILAGGSGTRLWPITASVSKQLLPVWDKPMIYYPLATLMLAGIREILLISTPRDLDAFRSLLGDGSRFGIQLSFAVQDQPNGLAEAMIISEQFLMQSPSALILGDNIFHGSALTTCLLNANHSERSSIFASKVVDPERYGVIGFDQSGRPTSIEEKPQSPKSQFAVTGLYFYSNDAPSLAKTLKPSARNELEITDLNRLYLDASKLDLQIFDDTVTWLDTGTNESLLQAAQLIEAIQTRHGMIIGCPEAVAYQQGWLSEEDVERSTSEFPNSAYSKQLKIMIHS